MELNRANRQVCDVDIRILKTMMPFLNFDTANTTTAGLTSDSVYAMAKGSRRIAFANPLEGTMTIEAQVYPFKFFSLLSNGEITTTAAYAMTQTVKATTAGELEISVSDGGAVIAGTVFVYPEDSYGDESALIECTMADNKLTANDASQIAVGESYTIAYMVNRTKGVKRISFNNKNLPQDYFITMRTADKDEQGAMTPFIITAYKATIKRDFELSFNSEGDPASVTLTFDLMEDKDGNVLDMIEEIVDEESATESTETPSTTPEVTE